MANAIRITVAPGSRNEPTYSTPFVLTQNNWDDFGFKTTYALFYSGPTFTGLIGRLKIMRRGQQTGYDNQLPVGTIGPLSDDWVSLGETLDFYERMASLPQEDREALLHALHDAMIEPEHAATFHDEPAWKTSLTRDVDMDEYASVATVLLTRDYTAIPSRQLNLSFQMNGWTRPLDLRFDADQGDDEIFGIGRGAQRLPERLAVITGRNGSGKSTLLSRLARVLHASQADRRRPPINGLGRIEPEGVGFSRIITVSYSAFDTFQVPGVGRAERRQIISDLRSGGGRYVFCGLRDIASELEARIDERDAETQSGDIATQEMSDAAADADDWFIKDRQPATHLKSVDVLADEFARNIGSAKAERARLLESATAMLLSDMSFSDVPGQSLDELLGDNPRESFARWSTGHKIVMHTIAAIVANARPKSIILMDEPESHLHPPLLAALMHALRRVLDDQDSFAIVATHSPVVAQETLGRHVSIVNRVENVTTILPPRIETYGESIGEIADVVFGLNPNATDYHKTLRAMVERGLGIEDIEGRFERGMSLQARAYVLTLLATRSA